MDHLSAVATECRARGVKIIAFGCKEGVGKDTAGAYLQSRGFTRLFFADGVYGVAGDIQRRMGVPVCKDPALLQFIGNGLKSVYGENVWVRALAEKLHTLTLAGETNIVITDLRHKVELDFLVAAGAQVYRVVRDERVLTRDPAHISEIDLDDVELPSINNNGSLAQLHAQLDAIIH
jgi:hypothetical protein